MIVKHKQFFFCIFCTTSTKILFLPHFQNLQIIEYGPLKFFPHIPFENIQFYVPENEKKNQNWFFRQFGWFSHVGSQFNQGDCSLQRTPRSGRRLHRLHVAECHISRRCKRERSIASPSIDILFKRTRTHPPLTHAGQRIFVCETYICRWSWGSYGLVNSRASSLSHHFLAASQSVLRATRILTSHVSPTLPTATPWA